MRDAVYWSVALRAQKKGVHDVAQTDRLRGTKNLPWAGRMFPRNVQMSIWGFEEETVTADGFNSVIDAFKLLLPLLSLPVNYNVFCTYLGMLLTFIYKEAMDKEDGQSNPPESFVIKVTARTFN